MVIELSGVQFWSEILLVISNRTRAARSFDFEITRMISEQIALHSVQLPLLIFFFNYRSPAIDDFICMLWKNKMGFQVDQTVSIITRPLRKRP